MSSSAYTHIHNNSNKSLDACLLVSFADKSMASAWQQGITSRSTATFRYVCLGDMSMTPSCSQRDSKQDNSPCTGMLLWQQRQRPTCRQKSGRSTSWHSTISAGMLAAAHLTTMTRTSSSASCGFHTCKQSKGVLRSCAPSCSMCDARPAPI